MAGTTSVYRHGWELVGIMLLAGTARGCRPSTVADAEREGDVAWLQRNDSPAAVAALGRLADTRGDAVDALKALSSFDVTAFRAAWDGVLRDEPWAFTMFHEAFADPKRADGAASAMTKRDPHLSPFADDLESALVRLSATPQNTNVASALASIGPTVRPAIERRLVDASTRGAMCNGIASPGADDDARKALLDVPEAARDAPSCVMEAVRIAVDDEAALAWLGERAEPGILGAAGKSADMPCGRLHVAWVKAFAARPVSAYAAMTVPLGYAVSRCAAQLDGVLADALAHLPAAHHTVVEAIDPFVSYGDGLRVTCVALQAVSKGPDIAVVRERASDVLMHVCKGPT